MQAKNDILASRGWYALAALSVIGYLITACWLTDNTPKFDDLNDVFGFFKQLALAQKPLQKLGAFFYPNNEHVTAFSHLIYFLQYQLLGEVHFYGLTLIGHLIIVATGCVLGCTINNTRKPFYFAIFTVGYLSLYYWDSSFKAMTAISNQAVILFSLATLFVLVRCKNFALGIFFALLATFTQGNGVLIWPVGAVILLFDTQYQAQRLRYVMLWLLTAACAALLYAWAKHTYGTPSPITLADVIEHWEAHFIGRMLGAALAFLGSTVFSTAHLGLAMTVGALALFAALFWLLRYRAVDWLISGILLFALASALTAGATRGLAFGAAGAVESRYKMYSLLATLLLSTVCIEYWLPARWRNRAAMLLLAVAMSIQLSAFRMVPFIQSQAQRFQETYRLWIEDGDFRRLAIYFPPMSDHFLFVADHLGIIKLMQFAPEAAILPRLPVVAGQFCPPTSTPAVPCSIAIRHRGNALAVVVSADSTLPALPATITLCDTQTTDAAMAFAIPETAAALQTWLIPEAEIPAGQYRVMIQPAQQAACETTLIKKPRKVASEMRTLFKEQTQN
jgi:hypothetical protein